MSAGPASTPTFLATVERHRQALLEALGGAAERQRRVREESVATNADTAFGRAHDFMRIRNLADFRAAVPIGSYADFSPWIERAAAGESGVLTAEDPLLFFTSSGSTGDPKKIPITLGFARDCFMPFLYATYAAMADDHADLLDGDDTVFSLKHDPGAPTGMTSAGRDHIGVSQLDFGRVGTEMREPGTNAPWGPLPEELLAAETFDRLYHRIRLAAEHEVRCLVGINPAQVAALPRLLERWRPALIEEIAVGTLAGRPHREPNPARAAELERLAHEDGALTPRHLWPQLELVVCWNTGLATLYLPWTLAAYGDRLRVRPAPVAASEGPIGIPLDDHPTAGPLAVGSVFYEFVPAEQDVVPESEARLFDELEEGREYHVLLTHPGGFYRYAVGDVVRVVGFVDGVPRVEYAGRATTIAPAGVRLREAEVVQALVEISSDAEVAIVNATARAVADPSGCRCELAVELAPGANVPDDLAGRFDRALANRSSSYREARSTGDLAEAAAHLAASGSFFLEWERRVRAGNRPPQVKDRVFWSDAAGWERLVG